MQFLRGRNWFEIKYGKNGRKGFFSGPLFREERGAEGRYRYHVYSFMTRRFKFRLIKDRELKQWKLSFAGLWMSEGTTNEFITYDISVHEFKS